MHTPWVSFDGKNCGGCKHLNERGYCEFTACIIPCVVSATIPEVKPQTNADRIRAMTDEELAKFLTTEDMCELICSPAPPHCDGQCKQKMLDWLKQEVAE